MTVVSVSLEKHVHTSCELGKKNTVGVLGLWDSVFAHGHIRWGHRWYFYSGSGVALVEFTSVIARDLIHSPY